MSTNKIFRECTNMQNETMLPGLDPVLLLPKNCETQAREQDEINEVRQQILPKLVSFISHSEEVSDSGMTEEGLRKEKD